MVCVRALLNQFCRVALVAGTATLIIPSTLTLAQQTPAATKPEAPAANPATQVNPIASENLDSGSAVLKLGVGDLVEVTVYGVPELSTKARIGSNGDLYLPLIDYVHVADLTLEEAQKVVEKRLSDGGFVNNPHVSLLVDEYASQGVTLLGEVSRPGIYPALGDRRLYDLISAAGGFTDKAGRVVTITHRDKPNSPVNITLPGNLAESSDGNVLVMPGDTVLVSRAGVVYVVGDVQRPSGFMIEDNRLTVLKALALAGGTNRTASMNGSKILRQTASGVQEIPVPIKKILEAKAHDEMMMKGDILFIPSSGAKIAAYKSVDMITSMATALTIIAVQ